MLKLNLGCGDRIAKGYLNFDYNSTHPDVQAYNLLKPLPFKDGEVDVIYMSHVLEHFTRNDGKALVHNCFRVLTQGGILRIVVPDLENICREYLAVLDSMNENPDQNDPRLKWIIIELLDQLVRTESGGAMSRLWREALADDDSFMLNYIASRTGTQVAALDLTGKPLGKRLKGINMRKIRKRLLKEYIKMVKRLLPKSIRDAALDNTAVGEKHKWMYDSHSLRTLLLDTGFSSAQSLTVETSGINGFAEDYLDTNTDGSPHKRASLYYEGVK